MQTAAISYRVADFLKQYPPFDSLGQEDLLALAARGRVKFHESDECFLWQGEKPGAHVFVIQQGSVSLWEKEEDGERLRDLLGPGEVVGVERYLGHAVNPWSARTNGDVVLYALEASEFGRLMGKDPSAARYLAWHAEVRAENSGDRRLGAGEGARAGELLTGGERVLEAETATIAEAARTMSEMGLNAVAVAESGRPAGVVTAERILRWVGEGGAEGLARSIAEEAPVVGERSTAAACILAMAEYGAPAIVAGKAGVMGVLTESEITPVFGENLAGIVRWIRGAQDTAGLKRLNRRVRGYLKEEMRSAVSVEWMSRYAQIVDGAILQRVVELCGADMERTCWCFYGAAGRGESLTAMAPEIAMIGPDAATCERVAEQLLSCGYLERRESASTGTLEDWKARFSGWISNPVLNGVEGAVSYFDLSLVCGSREVWAELKESVEAELRGAESFTAVMAHDCLASLPPLTFFRELVVEESGEQTGVFRLEQSALRPLVNVARVFGLEAGSVFGASTADRLRAARAVAPGEEAVLREAGETLRVVLYLQARAGLRQQDEGHEMPASRIDARERLVLKRGFRSILNLLESAEEFKWKGR